MSNNLTQRTIDSVTWNSIANIYRIGVLLIRSVFLARILPVDVFGVYSFATATMTIMGTFSNLGLDGAFIHRSKETSDEGHIASVHFTLKILVGIIWLFVMVPTAFFLADGIRLFVLLTLILMNFMGQFTNTATLIFKRRVLHKRLALMDVYDTTLTTIVAVVVAIQHPSIFALLSVHLVSTLVTFALLYVWQPVWRPKFHWHKQTVQYLFDFGVRNFGVRLLGRVLDRVDDLWVGHYLGDGALGFYSRAYAFAQYPSRLLAQPVHSVSLGTYAELKGDREKLSKAFYRTNAILIRTGFLLGGWLILVAPEFIRIVLTVKWLPMLDTFRLMLIYTLLKPINATVAQLFTAMGFPEKVAKTRFLQLVIMVLGLYLFGNLADIEGVAVAVDLMLVVGIVLLLYQAKTYADFSVTKLFANPTIALLVSGLLGYATLQIPDLTGDWYTGAMKTAVFVPLYVLILLLLEREDTKLVYQLVRIQWEKRRSKK